jgi:hypothetical protein
MAQISNGDLKDRRHYTTLAIKSAIEKREYHRLSEWIELADEYGVKKSLRYKAWNILGTQWKADRNFVDAAIALNAARRIKPLQITTVKLLFDCIALFVEENRMIFSQSDLTKIELELERILEFYKVKKLWTHPVIKSGRDLFHQIFMLKQTAKDIVETPATHKTDRIVKALRSNVSFQEVKADYARIIAPILRELLAKEIDEENPKEKKRSKKSPLKNPKTKKEKGDKKN